MILVFMQVIFIKENLKNIKHLEISLANNHGILLIQDIRLELWKNFSGIKLICNNIELKNNSSQFHIINEIFVSINFNVIYRKITEKNNDLPIFYLHANGFDVGAMREFYSTADQNKMIYTRNNNETYAKIVKFLNRKNINNFKVKVDFRNFNLPSTIGTFEVHKISFENMTLDKGYVAGIKIVYNLNGEQGIVNGFILKDKVNSQSNTADLMSALGATSNNTKLIFAFYGYINRYLTSGQYIIHPKEFYNVLLTYDFNNQDLEFDIAVKSLDLKMNNIPSISGENLKILAHYHLVNKTLFVKDFKFDLVSEMHKIPISGSANFDNDGSFEMTARSNSLIDKEVIYNLWPETAHLQKAFLQSLIVDTSIRNPIFFIKNHKSSNDKYKFDNLKLDFTLEKTTLSHDIKGYKYKLDTDKASVNVNLDGIKIQSVTAYIQDNIAVNNLAILFPIDLSKKVLCDFELNATSNNIQRSFNRYLDNIELLNGHLKLNIHAELPMQRFTFKDLVLSGKLTADRMNIIFNNKKRDFSSQNLLFELKNRRLSCIGDVIYNDMQFKQLHLLGDIYEDNGLLKEFKLKSADLKINLNQKKIQEMMRDIQSEVDGVLKIQVLDSKAIRLNLNDVAIIKNPLNFTKNLGIPGELDFTIDSEDIFKDINLNLPQFEATGDCAFTKNGLIDLNLQFKKLYNSIFTVTYSQIDNVYRINASALHIEDIQRIIDHLNTDRIINPETKIMHLDQKIVVMINADRILLDKKIALENTSLTLHLKSDNIVKLDGYAYAKDKKGYIRIFFDSPVFALIINNLGYLTDEALKIKTVNKGNLGLYLSIEDLKINAQATGDLYLYNFRLLESYLLSTILKIYALSGFGVNNIFQMFNNGINFSNMHCIISSNKQSIIFDNCQAFSDAMLLSAEAKLDLHSYNGELQGLIIPKNFLNAPIILLQQILSKKGKTLLDDMQDRQNFSITWSANGKPVIQTNPISFILPSIFSNFFSKKKTVKDKLNIN
jgi:hypothetical protein